MFRFPLIRYGFSTYVNEAFSASTPSLVSLPALLVAQEESRDVSAAHIIEYDLSFENVTLDRLSSPIEMIDQEGINAPDANQLVYGVYTADVNISMRLYNKKNEVLTHDASFIDRMLARDIFRQDLFRHTANPHMHSSGLIKARRLPITSGRHFLDKA